MDIIEYCSVPRYAHVDFPLGNPCGKPFDTAMQKSIAEDVLDLFGQATQAGTIVRLSYQWNEDQAWRDAYARVSDENLEHLRELGEQRRREQLQNKTSLAKIDFN